MNHDRYSLIGLIDQGAHFYICGDGTKMAPDVEQTLREAYQEVHGVNEEEAVQWLDRLLSQGQYAKDVWTGI
jgi:cytochrome P450/NADPH-cytochrome P450 reductase